MVCAFFNVRPGKEFMAQYYLIFVLLEKLFNMAYSLRVMDSMQKTRSLKSTIIV